MAIDFDVAIIGAGPSGSACALALQGKGLKVALFDKQGFPRDKICGDAIPGASFKAMDSINKNWGDQMKAFAATMEITSMAIFLSKTKVIRYNWHLFSYNSKRIDFDNFLFHLVSKETDTIIFENKRLQRITYEANYCQCFFADGSSIKAAIVVGCDGANSMVKRQLMQHDNETSHAITAIRAYYKGIEGMQEGTNEAHLIKSVYGYFWIFPLKDGWANVGFGVYKKRTKKNDSATNIRKTLEDITASDTLADRFKNASLQGKVSGYGLPIRTKRSQVCGDRFLLCGDAASLVDPLQGHGIDNAMWSGIIAAKQIIHCFEANDFSAVFIKAYEKMLNDKLGRDLSRNYWLMRILFRFPFLINLLSKLSLSQGVINWIMHKMRI